MKLLLDQNLSRHLAPQLASAFPGTRHVAELGLERADDEVVWARASADGFTIVSKDIDFYQRSILRGFPPKVIWLAFGNCRTREVLAALRDAAPEIESFLGDEMQSLLVLERVTD